MNLSSRAGQHEIRATLGRIQSGNLEYVADADKKIAESNPQNDRYNIGRKMRYDSWLQQKGTVNGLLDSILKRVHLLLPDGRLAQDDFIISSPSQTSEKILAKMMQHLNPNLLARFCQKIASLHTLGLDQEERLMRNTVLHIMAAQDVASIQDVAWSPLIRPHTLYGGEIRSWQYRCITGKQAQNWGDGNRGYAIIDKRNYEILRILIPQKDRGTVFYGQG